MIKENLTDRMAVQMGWAVIAHMKAHSYSAAEAYKVVERQYPVPISNRSRADVIRFATKNENKWIAA